MHGARPAPHLELDPDPDEPLDLWHRELPAGRAAGTRLIRFEFASRGDRVPGRLRMPRSASEPLPWVLAACGDPGAAEAGEEASSDGSALERAASARAGRGVAVACLDLPLLGARRSGKLTALLEAELREGPAEPDRGRSVLWRELVRQAVLDLRRALDGLPRSFELDPERVAFVGQYLGASVGAVLCGLDPRPCAAVLAGAGADPAAGELDPARWVQRISPRPLLLVNGTRDGGVTRRQAEALAAAARPPVEQRRHEGDSLPETWAGEAFDFLLERRRG